HRGVRAVARRLPRCVPTGSAVERGGGRVARGSAGREDGPLHLLLTRAPDVDHRSGHVGRTRSCPPEGERPRCGRVSSRDMTCRINLLVFGAIALSPLVLGAQGTQPPDQPVVTVRGQTYSPRSILARNMGSEEDQTTAFPPHRVIGNVYYVGTRTLSSFLITTPE